MARVIIVGGGITGTAAAFELARAGAEVTLLEGDSLASMGSGRTLAGVRQSGRHAAELPLATAAVRRWESLSRELEFDVEYRQKGNLRLARTPAERDVIRDIVAAHQGSGLEITFLDGSDQVQSIAPSLSENVIAASYCPSDGHANPQRTVSGFARAATRAGAGIREYTRVSSVTVGGGAVTGVEVNGKFMTADWVVVAAGVETPDFLRPLDIDLPISLGFVPVIQTVVRPPLIEQVLGTATANFAARQEVGGRVRFSSGGQFIDWPAEGLSNGFMQPTAQQMLETVQRAIEILPGLRNTRLQQAWGGLIDLTPDGLPIVEHHPGIGGLVIAAGFCGHGFCLGPVTGQIICEIITGQRMTFDIDAFKSDRFAADEEASSPRMHG